MIIIYVVSLPFKFRAKTSTQHVPFCTPNMVMLPIYGIASPEKPMVKTQSSGKALFFPLAKNRMLPARSLVRAEKVHINSLIYCSVSNNYWQLFGIKFEHNIRRRIGVNSK